MGERWRRQEKQQRQISRRQSVSAHRFGIHEPPADDDDLEAFMEGAGDGDDEEILANLPVKDFNRRLKDFPKNVATALKQKRRTIKNRG